LSAERDTSLRI